MAIERAVNKVIKDLMMAGVAMGVQTSGEIQIPDEDGKPLTFSLTCGPTGGVGIHFSPSSIKE